MQASLITVGMLAGGLGLFLLAVKMITDGLRLAAGNALRDILARATLSPARGIVSGIGITALVQSSSAVTVATIGFVNAGLLTLYQALGVVYGANIGTTTTGWLVALIGFNIKIEAFALPLIGVGMILQLTGSDTRRGSLGTALAGFGLFFIGIDILKEAFEGLATSIDLQRFTAEGVTGVLLYLVIGFFMTVLTQSSSAAIAITLTAATGGVIGPYAAAAMVVGANVGTTSTAVISVLGATPNAKRVAAAHVVFNGATGVVALLLLPIMFGLVKTISDLFGLEDIPVISLALFHTTFNVLGVVLMWPLTTRLVHHLEQRFTSLEEIEGRPKFLDKTVAVSPALALNALGLELAHVGGIARRMAKGAISTEKSVGRLMKTDQHTIHRLAIAVGEFVIHLQRSAIPKDIADELPKVLRTSQYNLMAAELARMVAKHQEEVGEIENDELLLALSEFKADVVKLIDTTDVQGGGFSIALCDQLLEELNVSYDELKEQILETGAASGMDIPSMSALLEQNSNTRRMVTQLVKAARYLSRLFTIADIKNESAKETIMVEANST